MPTDIGPRIGIDGEKEFRNELNHISQQLRTLGSEMKAVTSEFIGNEKSQEALAAQAGVLTRQIDAQEKKLAFVSLEVRVSNGDAIALYEKAGFKEEGRRKNFYRNPREDALIMKKRV